jgi:hypothetical protein
VVAGPLGLDVPSSWHVRMESPNPSGNVAFAFLSPAELPSDCEATGAGGVCHPWPITELGRGGVVVAVRLHGMPGSRPPTGGDPMTLAGLPARRISGPADSACRSIGGSALTQIVLPAVPNATGWISLDACFEEPNPAPAEAVFDVILESVVVAADAPSSSPIASIGESVQANVGAGPSATVPPPAPATQTDGPFRLELALPRQVWRATDVITGTATLSYAGAGPTTVSGSGSGVIAFAYAEVGGNRRVDPAWRMDCRPYPLDPTAPITAGLSKSGAFDGNEADVAFLRAFLTTDPGVIRLPAGTWDVSAVAEFLEGDHCSGGSHAMTASVRITMASTVQP